LTDFDQYRLAILNDIFIVDEAYNAIFFISDHCDEINAPFVGHLFGKLQNSYFVDAMILAIARVFDNRKDVLSIPGLIQVCERFTLKNKSDFASALRSLGVPQKTIEIVETEGLSQRASRELRKSIPLKSNLPELQRVLHRRHKSVAHRAVTPGSTQPFFADIKKCNDLAKAWISCFALGIEDQRLHDSKGRFRFSGDARQLSASIKRILQIIGLMKIESESDKRIVSEFRRRQK